MTSRPSGRARSPSGPFRITESLRPFAAAFLLTVTATLSPVSVLAAQLNAPARNWTLPVFSKEGFRQMLARGSEAQMISQREFVVTDLNLTFFTGTADSIVDTVILSPAATFLPEQRVAHGEKYVRFIRDDLEATGIRWTYHHTDKKISLDGNVRVTFRAEIANLLE